MDQEEPLQQATVYQRDSIYGRLENFGIDKKIGKGQFSEVYRARCKVDGSVVALKKVQVNLQLILLSTLVSLINFNITLH